LSRARLTLLLTAVLLLAALVLACAVGSVWVPPGRVLAALLGTPETAGDAIIVLELRLPRVALAGTVGASLALSGAALQGLFRNPLADPSVLGVSAGGALGAAIAVVLGLGSPAPLALVGAALAALWVYGLSRGALGSSLSAVLLAGVAVGLTLSALLALVLLAARDRAPEVYLWLLGNLAGRGWTAVLWSGAALALGGGALALLARSLDALSLGPDLASNLGVRVTGARLGVLAATALLVAGATAFAGLIGFVGLVVPQVMRRFVGPLHGPLLPAAALGGAAALVLADLAARSILPTEIPVGVITGLVGGPFFLWVLRAELRRRGGATA
jgi:iron complex transport system permease protein